MNILYLLRKNLPLGQLEQDLERVRSLGQLTSLKMNYRQKRHV